MNFLDKWYVTKNDFGGQAWFELNVVKPQKLSVKGTFFLDNHNIMLKEFEPPSIFPYVCTIVPHPKFVPLYTVPLRLVFRVYWTNYFFFSGYRHPK